MMASVNNMPGVLVRRIRVKIALNMVKSSKFGQIKLVKLQN